MANGNLTSPTSVVVENILTITDVELETIIAALPSWRAEKVMAYKHHQGRKESAIAFHLLQQVLREKYGISDTISFDYNEHGKPSIMSHPDIHFNLSHCKLAVACVVSDYPVGVDVEALGRYKESLARHVLNDAEFTQVLNSENPDLAFTILWTKKEAVLKLVGTGVSNDMKDVLLEHGDKKITTTICDGYVYSVAE